MPQASGPDPSEQAMLSYRIFPDLNFTWLVSQGETTIEGWLQTVARYRKAGVTAFELYDLRQQANLFSMEEIGRILDHTDSNQAFRPPKGKTAILVDEAVKFGLARMYEMQAEIKSTEWGIQVFYELEKAANWLGADIARLVSESDPWLSIFRPC